MNTTDTIDKITQLAKAATVDEVLNITATPGSLTGHFWEDDDDDFAAALQDADWMVTYSPDGPFWFVAARDPNNCLEYVEGDVYPLDRERILARLDEWEA